MHPTLSQFPLRLHAFNDGQHSPRGMGARVPSGQILKSHVQNTLLQLGLRLHAFSDGQHSPHGTGAGLPSGQRFRSKVQRTPRQSIRDAIRRMKCSRETTRGIFYDELTR